MIGSIMNGHSTQQGIVNHNAMADRDNASPMPR
jgi:hypothetical protein